MVYVPEVSLDSIQPQAILADGGPVTLLVHGHNFINTTSLRCTIGSAVVRAQYISDELIICLVPSRGGLAPAYTGGPLHSVPAFEPTAIEFGESPDRTSPQLLFEAAGPTMQCPGSISPSLNASAEYSGL